MMPQLDLIPLQAAVASDRPTTLDLLVKVTPPPAPASLDRPPLNLGLVLDRSGSMQGHKLKHAKQAVAYAIEQLLPSDRVSLCSFDNTVRVEIPSTLAQDKQALLAIVNRIHTGGSTALHAGWLEGGVQVSQHLNPQHLNRVLLLSDGLANVGETNPDRIAHHVQGLTQRGVSTSTMGLGNDYDEDLLAAIAAAGDGNFFHIESPAQLPDFFATELQGLMATLGRQVSLGLRGQGSVIVQEVFNDLPLTARRNYMLPNLSYGSVIYVGIRLKVPAMAEPQDLLSVRLAWDDPEQPQRQEIYTRLHLPVLLGAEVDALPTDPEVQEQLLILQAARAREEAIHALDRRDYAAAVAVIEQTSRKAKSMPSSAALQNEIAELERLSDRLTQGDYQMSRKEARYQSHNAMRSRDRRPKKY